MLQKIKIYTVLLGTLAVGSCTKNFKDLNTYHDKPTTTSIQPLMTGIIGTLPLQWQEQASIHNDYYYEVTQLAGETSLSGYVLQNGVSSIWTDYYNSLQNMNLIQDKINESLTPSDWTNVQAILYILRAYKTFRMTDQFGDIPYFNAGKTYLNESQYYRPAYDKQQAIYDTLLMQLTWAVHNINATPGAFGDSLGAADVLFNGNMIQWQKFGNSLRLRQAMQMVEKDPTTATPIIADALSGTYPLVDSGNDVAVWPKSLGGLDLGGHWWSFSSGGTGFVRVSSTVWNLMSDNTTPSGIFDPRALLFTATNAAGVYKPYVIGVNTGDAVNAYQSATDPSQKNNCIYSPFNWYLVRDEWYVPEPILTEAEVHFLKAEAYARGIGVTENLGTAWTEYAAGVKSSVNFWYNVAANTNDASTDWAGAAPPAPTATQMTALFANPKVAFTGGQADALSKIYAQEWLSFYRQPWLAFNLWRRTGNTPVDPNSKPGTNYTTFLKLPYAQDEAVNNPDNYMAETGGTNATNVKVWWQP